jgi:hypothetical protein
MTVYFTASIVGKKHYLPNYLKIIEVLKSKGLQVIFDHIIKTTESEIRMETKEDRLCFQRRLEKWINSCHFVVAETSFPSISVGFEISLALHLGKPVLILYCEGHPPSLLAHHTEEKLICEKYSNHTLQQLIEDFVNYVQGESDTKFTFFINREMATYLDKISKKEKIPKSVYLRNLIENKMRTSK